MSTGPVQLNSVTIGIPLQETLLGQFRRKNWLRSVTIGCEPASKLNLKVINRLNEPIESALCEVLDGVIEGNKNCLYLDTVDDYLRYNSGIPIPAGANFKTGLWLKPTAWEGANPGIWRSLTDSRGTTFCIFQGKTGRPWIRLDGANILQPSTGYQLPLNEWHYIEFEIISGSVARFYVDGEIKHTANHSITTPSFSIFNFGYQYAIDQRVAGNYRDIKIEVNSNVVMNWPIDEGEGTTLNDISGNDYHGAIFGATWVEDEDLPVAESGAPIIYDPTPYDSASTNANGLVTLDYKINQLHGLRVTINGKRNFIMPFQRDNYSLLDWQVKLDNLLAAFITDGGKVLINGQPYNNDNNILIG